MRNIFVLILLSSFAFAASAVEKRYVTDSLFLQLRTGPSLEYRIIKALRTGEHLIVLEEDDGSGYTKVRTDKGLEGYVLSRFLENEPVAKEKLILAERELAKLKAELATIREQNNAAQNELRQTKSERSGLDKAKSELEQELEHIKSVSASALELNAKNKELTQRNRELEIQIETVTTENTQMRDSRQQTFLLYGGGLVVIGILAGLILPALRGAKRNSSNWA